MSSFGSSSLSTIAGVVGSAVALAVLPWDATLSVSVADDVAAVGVPADGVPAADGGGAIALPLPGGASSDDSGVPAPEVAAPSEAGSLNIPSPTQSGSSPGPSAPSSGGGETGGGETGGGETGGGETGGGETGGGETGGGGKSVAAPVKHGQGATASTIKIGVIVGANTEDEAAVGIDGDASSGGSGLTSEQSYELVADWINANGGVGGRNIEFAYEVLDLRTSTETTETELCTAFADDHEVFGVILTAMIREKTRYCYRDKKIIAVDSSNFGMSEFVYQNTGGYVWAPGQAGLESTTEAAIRSFARRGWFDGPTAKLGVAYYDFDSFETLIEEVFKPTFEEATGRSADEIVFSPVDPSDAATLQTGITRAIAAFRGNLADRVMFVGGAPLSAFFELTATNSGYTPVYGLTSVDNPQYMERTGSPSLQGSVALGTLPVQDVRGNGPGDMINASAKACYDLFIGAGAVFEDRYATSGALARCDAMLFYKAVGDRMTGDFTQEAFAKAANGLGDSFVSPLTHRTNLHSTRHWGGATYHEMEFASDCACFKYTSGANRFVR